MRFSTASAALFAGAALAVPHYQETVYSTKQVTITSCAPDVPDCPGNGVPAPTDGPAPIEDTPIVSTAWVTVTDCGEDVPDCPGRVSSTVFQPVPTPSSVDPVPSPSDVQPVPPFPTGNDAEPSTSVVTYTTCIVTSSTITIVPTPSVPIGTGFPPVPPQPTLTGVPAPPSSTAVPPGTNPPEFDSAASATGVSFLMAGVAAIAALLF
ncbi:hypothetical protein VTO42DRAFT_26 [Malbranchea cinnamomea]